MSKSNGFVPPPAPPEAHRKPRRKKAAPTVNGVPLVPVSAVASDLPARLKSKVAIVGFAPHNTLTPFADPEWEIWGINRLHVQMPNGRFDRWFELHDLDDYKDANGVEDASHFGFLRAFPEVFVRPIDVGTHDLPNAKPFPLDALLREFTPYFTNTISYLVALAILMGYEEIGLWGVDMAQDQMLQMEFGEQRPSVEYFLGIAAGREIKVTIPDGADLLVAAYLYGFGDPSPLRAKLEWRFQELNGRKDAIKQQLAQMDAQKIGMVAHLNQLDGAMQDSHYLLRNILPAMKSQEFAEGKEPK